MLKNSQDWASLDFEKVLLVKLLKFTESLAFSSNNQGVNAIYNQALDIWLYAYRKLDRQAVREQDARVAAYQAKFLEYKNDMARSIFSSSEIYVNRLTIDLAIRTVGCVVQTLVRLGILMEHSAIATAGEAYVEIPAAGASTPLREGSDDTF